MDLKPLEAIMAPARKQAIEALVNEALAEGSIVISDADRSILIDLATHGVSSIMLSLFDSVDRSERVLHDSQLSVVLFALIAKVASFELESVTNIMGSVIEEEMSPSMLGRLRQWRNRRR